MNQRQPLVLAYIAGSIRAAGGTVRGVDATGQNIQRIDHIPGTAIQKTGKDPS